MRIAHLAPPWLPIPPKNYGGTENVIYRLIEEQVAQGHSVTLLAPGDAQTSAKQVSFFSESLAGTGRPWHSHPKAFYHTYKSIEYMKKYAHRFDILHSHLSSSSDLYMFPLTADLPLPHVVTLHSQFPFDRVDSEWMGDADEDYMEWIAQVPMVAISRSAQKQEQAKFPLNFIGVVHHGVDVKSFPAPETPDNYFAWIGRVVPEKGLHLAIEAAKKAQVPLVIAGFIDPGLPQARCYFEEQIKPEIDGDQIRFIGPVSSEQRNALLSKARGMLNPLQWEEPFGMVMLEALALGCPVIAFRRGAAEELIIPGETGFLVEDVAGMVEGIRLIDALERKRVRAYAEAHFSSYKMAKNYTRVYEKVIKIREEKIFAHLSNDMLKYSEALVS